MQEPGPVLLITRPDPAGADFALSVIEALGRPVDTILSPALRIAPIPDLRLGSVPAAVVLTSVHGADASATLGLPVGLPAWCVGHRTAEAARAAGLVPTSADGDAAALIGMILAARPDGPLLHLRGEHVSADIAGKLSAAGLPCAELVCYRQEVMPPSRHALAALRGSDPLIVPLFSPRSVSILAQSGPFTAPITVVAISDAVARVAAMLRPVALVRADRPDAEAMRRATCRAIDANSLPSGA